MPRRLAPISALAFATALPATAQDWDFGTANVPSAEPAFANQTRAPKQNSVEGLTVETIASGLEHPWGIEVLPEGGYLVTERSGALRAVSADGTVSDPISGVPDVLAQGQGGLLDVALSPDFAETGVIFLTYSKAVDGGSATAAARAVLSDDLTSLSDVRDIFVQTPASPTTKHYGSRIVPVGDLVYITTGEHSTPAERVYAQDLDKTYGKIVRLSAEGEVPSDNPFVGAEDSLPSIWSFGHRNIQGAAIQPDTETLWALEHGPKGGDELNLIAAGANYGWPLVSYGETYGGRPIGTGAQSAEGMSEPRYYWDPVIAPGGMLFYEGEMFPEWQGDVIAASLSPGAIVRLDIEGDSVAGEERFLTGEGRIRDVELAPDGALLALIDDANGSLLRITPGQPAN